ncbi:MULTISPECIES: aldehyde dehydrogenase (NADP(+)) [unclassified Novosphingobium]|uniref:aldehyde dehydrogenase (NADP(+)) n=1 Tax=unclassified Novosphingobium TaxID=2644732 RepID=UPI00146DA19E|nr:MULTISPECIES: aldehyde dehydrogenase (NADP(+)) [unclassified Novosphingobium]NMN06577.1 NADP-dependent aldehyde dehydrogenase [Novosphingobium sp. SG919]NMN88973.1 NADP-dependent aldehyde dehydrogenase [Novosphingobium sp. SG916]
MDGAYLIGGESRTSTETFTGIEAATGHALEGDFSITPLADIAQACALAATAFDTYRETAPETRASFLEAIATALEARAEAIIARAMLETGLPQGRLAGELGRTTGQLRLFATVVREGAWAGAVIEAALPDRQPLPRPALAARQIPLGPVAVFGASNFPLAFSVAGGDTASALAAGCPVVVKAHPAHPGTSRLAGEAIAEAVAKSGLPGGVFSLVQGPGNDIGTALVADPAIKAVGFTGSRRGGVALMGVAAARAEPIPVYAEMSSINPVLLFPAALAARAEDLGKAYVGSLSLFAGQFCTNPGLVIALDSPDLERFLAAAAQALAGVAPQVMLTRAIAAAYAQGIETLASSDGVNVVAAGAAGNAQTGAARLLTVDAARLLADSRLTEEVFGPSSLVVRAQSTDEIAQLLEALEGQLTATLHLDEADHALAAPLIPVLERKVGRILANGWPTGVEVSRSMVHGGPYPATSDGRSTSVGAMAIHRFLRPVCYQALPDALLPAALQAANPQGLPRQSFA